MIMRALITSMLLVLAAPAFAAWPSSGLPLATGPADRNLGVTLVR